MFAKLSFFLRRIINYTYLHCLSALYFYRLVHKSGQSGHFDLHNTLNNFDFLSVKIQYLTQEVLDFKLLPHKDPFNAFANRSEL